jgi:hypothetical protein
LCEIVHTSQERIATRIASQASPASGRFSWPIEVELTVRTNRKESINLDGQLDHLLAQKQLYQDLMASTARETVLLEGGAPSAAWDWSIRDAPSIFSIASAQMRQTRSHGHAGISVTRERRGA